MSCGTVGRVRTLDTGKRHRVSGAVRVYVRKPGQCCSVRSGLPLCTTLFGDRVLGVENSGITLDRHGAPALSGHPDRVSRTHGYVPRKAVGNT